MGGGQAPACGRSRLLSPREAAGAEAAGRSQEEYKAQKNGERAEAVEDAATTRDTSIVEKKMESVGLLLRGYFIAEAYYLRLDRTHPHNGL